MSAIPSPQRAAFLRLLAAMPFAAAAPAWANALSEADYLTTTARLLAGLDPESIDRSLAAVIEQPAWQRHKKASQSGAQKLKGRLDAIDAWRRANLGEDAIGGRTLIYPFSGPDFVNAFALFPQYDNYVFFSLEEPGRPPQLERMAADVLDKTLVDLRTALNDLVHLNFFITPNMGEQMRASSLQGVAAVLMAMMGLLDLRIERVRQVDLWPERSAEIANMPAARRPKLPLQAMQIDFKRPGSARWQTLWYFSLDVSDLELRHYPEFVPWLRAFQDPVVLLKSASYLLHGENFKKVRSFILDRAVEIVQDDTGLPYRMLARPGWKIALHGQYEQPVDLFKHRYQDDLAAAFQQTSTAKAVPFPFGYNWRQRGNSFVIVARRERLTS